jgi:hypothetical protein
VVLIAIERLSFPSIGRGIDATVPIKSFGISNQIRGGILRKVNVRPGLKEAALFAAHEILADSRKVRTHRKLFKVEGKEKLLGFGPPTPGVG